MLNTMHYVMYYSVDKLFRFVICSGLGGVQWFYGQPAALRDDAPSTVRCPGEFITTSTVFL